uniref:Uncharacterized protein n=1 Tax=Arion vulgaris TaxID=1028688 RepID=A0A0B6Y226_9EUPU
MCNFKLLKTLYRFNTNCVPSMDYTPIAVPIQQAITEPLNDISRINIHVLIYHRDQVLEPWED